MSRIYFSEWLLLFSCDVAPEDLHFSLRNMPNPTNYPREFHWTFFFYFENIFKSNFLFINLKENHWKTNAKEIFSTALLHLQPQTETNMARVCDGDEVGYTIIKIISNGWLWSSTLLILSSIFTSTKDAKWEISHQFSRFDESNVYLVESTLEPKMGRWIVKPGYKICSGQLCCEHSFWFVFSLC